MRAATPASSDVTVLLRGEPAFLSNWTSSWQFGRVSVCLAVIGVGAGLYGAAMGAWRAPLQAVFVAVKFPLIILLTSTGNALLNAIIAPLLGVNISFRQSFLAILMSFTIASAILGSFSPLAAFIVWNAPPMTSAVPRAPGPYNFILLTHVVVIAFAGVTANLRLVQLLRQLSGNTGAARRVLLAWLAGNLLLGTQLCWICRPFIGSPGLPVEFLRATAFKGNFFETVFRAASALLH